MRHELSPAEGWVFWGARFRDIVPEVKLQGARTQNEPPSAQSFSIRAKAFENDTVGARIKTGRRSNNRF